MAFQLSLKANAWSRLKSHSGSTCTPRRGARNAQTHRSASSGRLTIVKLERFEEAKSLLRRILPIERRVHGENDEATLKMLSIYAEALYRDDGASLDDVREAVTTLEDAARIARRVLGGAHPLTSVIESISLQNARAALALALAK